MVVLGKGTGARNSILVLWHVILKSYLLQDRLEYRQQFDSRFLQEGKVEIGDEAHFFQRFLLNQLLGEVAAEVLSVVDKEVGDEDSLVGVQGCVLMLMHL